MRLRTLIISLIALGVFATDQATKYLVDAHLELNRSWYPFPALKSIFAITYIHNTGAAFGILQNQNTFFAIVAAIIIATIIYYIRSAPHFEPLVTISLGLQLGGACGNLLDRLRYGYVIDFFHVRFWTIFDIAIFNVADACITVGVALLAYQLIFCAPQRSRLGTISPASSPSAIVEEKPAEKNQ